MFILCSAVTYYSLCSNKNCLSIWLLYLHFSPAWLLFDFWTYMYPEANSGQSQFYCRYFMYHYVWFISIEVMSRFQPFTFQPSLCDLSRKPWLLSYCNAPSNVVLSWSCFKCIQIYPSPPITALSPLTPHTLGSVSVTNPLKIHHMI